MSIDHLSSNKLPIKPSEFIKIGPPQTFLPAEAQSAVGGYPQEIQITKDKLTEVIKGMNQFLQPSQTSLKFELHEGLKEYHVSIVDDVTKEVVREIPSKKLLDVYAAMTEFLGLVVDKKI
ncbi:flagellar protein FlaG [Bacillus pinisoli]|uniref:flagellar protein FlaG n=1 Tax=Bacillus pinisoli TaxID=2901866 RepID=UPI001FF6BA85|nr:flagellar protein FlaG [Bacillus pinisoli]